MYIDNMNMMYMNSYSITSMYIIYIVYIVYMIYTGILITYIILICIYVIKITFDVFGVVTSDI